MWNRKRGNTWIFIELALVFCLVWYVSDYFFVLRYNLSLPNYRNMDNTFQVTLGQLPQQASDYNPEEAEADARLVNLRRIVGRIKDHPGVEACAITEFVSQPGSGGYSSMSFIVPSDTLKNIYPRIINVDPESDYLRVFGHTADFGRKKVSTGDYNLVGDKLVILSRTTAQTLGISVGQELRNGKDTTIAPYRCAGIIDDTKRFDYQRPEHTIYMIRKVSADNVNDAIIAVRLASSSPAETDAFREWMQDNLRLGNYYFRKMISYRSFSEETDRIFGLPNDIRLRLYLMAFLLINILLCVIGTFWYRVNKRREETGIRKALGATQASIRRQFILEGILLLTIASLPAMLIEANLVNAGLIDTLGRQTLSPEQYLPDRPIPRFLIVNMITWLLMAAVVFAAIWLPARNAAAMQSADALRHE
jgi:hypothetical protein